MEEALEIAAAHLLGRRPQRQMEERTETAAALVVEAEARVAAEEDVETGTRHSRKGKDMDLSQDRNL